MTSLTGSVAVTNADAFPHPNFPLTIIGSIVQGGIILYAWLGLSSAQNGDLHDPWTLVVAGTFATALAVWVSSVVTGTKEGGSNPSIVDRLWSTLPVFCAWVMLLLDWNLRRFVMTCLVTLWGSRLTYNFYIKGGFSGGEDHRWVIVRLWYPGLQWEVFNFIFIVIYQLLLIVNFMSPVATATSMAPAWGFLDTVATVLCVLLVLGEAIADHQQFVFQTEKYRRREKNESLGPVYSKGFLDSGLWAYSRHPNYFCEVSFWCAFYIFSVPATGKLVNWTLSGCILLALLFLAPTASVDLSESLSNNKYPGYKDYQARVSRFVPWFPKAKSE